MEIIDAVWEKRNFGFDVAEVILDKKDARNINTCVQEIQPICNSYKYVTLKVPTGNLDLLHALENIGFRFMEAQLKLYCCISEFVLPKLFEMFTDQKAIQMPLDEDNVYTIISKLKEGIFDTDRISLDPKFGTKVGVKRYSNWIKELSLKKNILAYKVMFYEDEIGFGISALTPAEKRADLLLGGLFKQYKGIGLGFLMIYEAIKLLKSMDYEHVETKVSSNNLEVLKLYSKLGFCITNTSYVLRIFSSN